VSAVLDDARAVAANSERFDGVALQAGCTLTSIAAAPAATTRAEAYDCKYQRQAERNARRRGVLTWRTNLAVFSIGSAYVPPRIPARP
jgi:hypothetical protein